MVITGGKVWHTPTPEEIVAKAGQEVAIKGYVHNVRELGGIAFIILRTGRYLYQTVFDKKNTAGDLADIKSGYSVELTGVVNVEPRAQNGFELHLKSFKVLATAQEYPLNMADKKLKATLGTNLEYRSVALRHPQIRAPFKIVEGIEAGFREYLLANGFTMIHSPKIVANGAEGGADVFRLGYFGQDATLAQSPQLYKQTAVAFFDRVFEIGAVYRAELHNTSRHLNEYIGLDIEMGFIDSMYDIMEVETGMLKYVVEHLRKNYQPEIEQLNIDLPVINEIPVIRLADAIALMKTMGGGKNKNDLTPEDETMLCEHIKKTTGSDFVFVTHYPSAKRPFYVKDSVDDPTVTESFDLLFRGLEITSGGQRVNDYDEQIAKLKKRGMNPEAFESFTDVHKHGLPPHGGLGIGLERLAMKMCGFNNIRDTSMWPRDITHLNP